MLIVKQTKAVQTIVKMLTEMQVIESMTETDEYIWQCNADKQNRNDAYRK
jgi:hypothetical protein